MMPVRNESAGIATLHAPSALINDTAWLAGNVSSALINDTAWLAGNVSLLASVSAPTANVATMALAIICHIPLGLILFFLLLGALERFGFLCLGRKFVAEGALSEVRPLVCVQLAMYNEYAVAERIITAACAMRWPREQLEVQVLDDSTDPVLRAMIDEVVERERESGTNVHVMRREERSGYKAGALEAGRKQTDARFLVLFDADFIPSADFIERTVSRFYDETGDERTTLALVQAQWGHLNPASSMLTAHQSLWIDDHHTLQMSFRSAAWGFINFTGTAGTWRAEAIERAGGWSAKSLVEDCELSFRVLFSGYTTSFVRDVVQQSENPDTWTAYKAQQKRWTQGWVQLMRLHATTLLFTYECSFFKRLALLYHMLIALQWPLWFLWLATFPWLIEFNLTLVSGWVGQLLYICPMPLWLVLASVLASTFAVVPGDPGGCVGVLRRGVAMLRLVPYAFVSAGMIVHQTCSVFEGLFGHMSVEFERTAKRGMIKTDSWMDIAAPPSPALSRRQGEAAKNKPACVHWYVYPELLFLVYQGVMLGLYSVQLQRTAAAGTGILLEDVEGVALSAFLFLGVAYSLSRYCDDVTHEGSCCACLYALCPALAFRFSSVKFSPSGAPGSYCLRRSC